MGVVRTSLRRPRFSGFHAESQQSLDLPGPDDEDPPAMLEHTLIAALAAALAVGCGNKAEDGAGSGAADKAGSDTEAKPKPPAQRKYGDKQFFDYPPDGEGPHDGWDLNALRDKLQGAWLVGGGFYNAPDVWHIEGDLHTVISDKGEKKTTKMQLLAPCYYVAHDMDEKSATYSHFVFDGDTLYAGLGNAGVRKGKTTLGCMSISMWAFDGETCTKWNKANFARPGEKQWDKENGECGYSEDGKTFWTDDTNSSRKVYRKQQLSVIINDALMTQQMTSNKAVKTASLDEALETQKAKTQEIEERKTK